MKVKSEIFHKLWNTGISVKVVKKASEILEHNGFLKAEDLIPKKPSELKLIRGLDKEAISAVIKIREAALQKVSRQKKKLKQEEEKKRLELELLEAEKAFKEKEAMSKVKKSKSTKKHVKTVV